MKERKTVRRHRERAASQPLEMPENPEQQDHQGDGSPEHSAAQVEARPGDGVTLSTGQVTQGDR